MNRGPEATSASRPSPAVQAFATFLGAAGILAFAEMALVSLLVPRPASGWTLRAAHLAFVLAETVGVGAAAGLLAALFSRARRRPLLFGIAVLATACAIEPAIGENLTRVASLTFDGRLETPLAVLYRAVLAFVLPGAVYLAAYGSQSRWRAASVGLSLTVAFVLVALMPRAFAKDDYQGIHAVLSAEGALVAGAALASVVARHLRTFVQRRVGRALLALFALGAMFGLVFPPPNEVRCELFRLPSTVAPWVLASLWPTPHLHASVAAPASAWFRDRSAEPPTKPSERLLPVSPVVVLVTLDGVRAEAVLDPANDALFPTLATIKRAGVVFTEARSPASQTALSLAAVFSGRTFSEQLWADHGQGATRFLYPAEDPSPRFPELLAQHGVTTANFASLSFLSNDFGVVRGFSEEQIAVQGSRHARANEVLTPLLAALDTEAPLGRPFFAFVHLLEPHAPYRHGDPAASLRARYLAGIAAADVEIGRVLHFLKRRFGDRWLLIVSADHGEALGEHETTTHGKSLYEELLRVPLVVVGPRVRLSARRVDTKVTLVDLGPTILDLFGVDTPASFLGQSLVPALTEHGAETQAPLDRPIFAEGRLRRALVMPDDVKVIEDLRRKTIEVYDLRADPGETENLFDREPDRADAALVALRTFFAAHTRTAGGYEPPFKP